jgi:hypothetical protein
MKSEPYRHCLEAQKYQGGTITAQMHRAGRVEEHHGYLDEHYKTDRMEGLISALTYSTNDKRHNRPNPSKIAFDGDIYSNLASYRVGGEFIESRGNRRLAPANPTVLLLAIQALSATKVLQNNVTSQYTAGLPEEHRHARSRRAAANDRGLYQVSTAR